jgi:hypothetical protein
MDQTYSPGDAGGTLQRKSRRRAALGSFPTQHESSLPFVPMISLEEVLLSAGTVKILIMNVQLITGGDLLFLMDVIWMNRKWFLLRQHDEFIRFVIRCGLNGAIVVISYFSIVLFIIFPVYCVYCSFCYSDGILVPFSLCRIQPSAGPSNHTDVLAFYRAWLTECPNATALIQHALAMKPEVWGSLEME